MTESAEQGFNNGLEDLEGYMQAEFEDVAKHAEKLGFHVFRGDLVSGLESLDAKGKRTKKKHAVHAVYEGGILELFRNPEDHELGGKSILMEGLVQREFKDENIKDICKAVTAAKAEADDILKEFESARQQILDHINSGNNGILIEIAEALPDYAGYWMGQKELFCVWLNGRNCYRLMPLAPKRKSIEYDSLPKLKAAAKRITNKFLKDQNK